MPDVHFLDGNVGTVNQLMKNIEPETNKQTVDFYYSGKAVDDQQELQRIKKYMLRLDEMEKIE